MKTKSVKRKLNLQAPPKLTAARQKRLRVLAARPDSAIDYSDIPASTDVFWKQAVRNPFYKPTKQVTTVRLDADVLLWLKGQGKGYQTRINSILRNAMLRAIEVKV